MPGVVMAVVVIGWVLFNSPREHIEGDSIGSFLVSSQWINGMKMKMRS